jgi:hypothetical protein
VAPSATAARCERGRVSEVDALGTVLRAAASGATFVALEAEMRGIRGARNPEVITHTIAIALMPTCEHDQRKRDALVTLLLPFVQENLAWQPAEEKETHP